MVDQNGVLNIASLIATKGWQGRFARRRRAGSRLTHRGLQANLDGLHGVDGRPERRAESRLAGPNEGLAGSGSARQRHAGSRLTHRGLQANLDGLHGVDGRPERRTEYRLAGTTKAGRVGLRSAMLACRVGARSHGLARLRPRCCRSTKAAAMLLSRWHATTRGHSAASARDRYFRTRAIPEAGPSRAAIVRLAERMCDGPTRAESPAQDCRSDCRGPSATRVNSFPCFMCG